MMSNTGTRLGGVARMAVAVVAAGLLVTGCSQGATPPANTTSPGGGTETSQAPGTAPIEGRPAPVDQQPESALKIAMIGFANNPYWVSVQAGAEYANDVLQSHNGSVDWITAGDNIDVQTVSNAIKGAAAQGYSGIGFFIAGEGNCADIEALASDTVKLGAYNTLFPCVESSGGTVNYAQEQFKAGQLAAQEMIKATGDKAGSVGIIVSQFTAPGSEQRRKGFIEGLEGSNLTVIGEGVEAKDSASNTFTAAQNYLGSNADLLGIYATAGGPFGAAEAVAAAGKQDTVKVIGFDVTEENIAAIKDGSMHGVIGQDAFGQGYNVAIELFNALVTGQNPDPVLQEAYSPFVSAENVADHDPATVPLGTPGAS